MASHRPARGPPRRNSPSKRRNPGDTAEAGDRSGVSAARIPQNGPVMNYQSRPPAARIRPYLSAERLAPYQLATGGDPEKALRLYEWNAQVGAAFLEILGHLEIVLRNALDRQLQIWHDAQGLPGRWYDDPLGVFDPHRRDDVSTARQRLQRDGKSETPGRIIAELSFGFWRFLLGRHYQNSLWAHALRHAFPGLQPQRRADVYDLVDAHSRLRNRIAHHEPVHQLDLARHHEDVLRLAGYVDADVQAWIASVSRVGDVLASRP